MALAYHYYNKCKWLAAVKARKKKLKREANEKALNRMVADAREMYSTI